MEGTPEEIFQHEEKIREVQLLIPESIQFMKQFNEKFGSNLPLTKQTIREIAQKIKRSL